MFSYLHKLLPQFLDDTKKNCTVVPYNTRQSNHIQITNFKYEFSRSTIMYSGPKLWNSLDSELQNCPSLNSFYKRKYKLKLIALYTQQKCLKIFTLPFCLYVFIMLFFMLFILYVYVYCLKMNYIFKHLNWDKPLIGLWSLCVPSHYDITCISIVLFVYFILVDFTLYISHQK